MVKWNKQGLIYSPNTSHDWSKTHSQLPTPLHLNNSIYRVFVATRDSEQKSHISFFDIDLKKPTKILKRSTSPILFPGKIGFFDQHGVYPSSVLRIKNKIYLYYIGWSKGYEAPLFYAAIGLAISVDGGKTFSKYSELPIMERGVHDPCLVTAPNVFINQKDDLCMIYTSGFKWDYEPNGDLCSHYDLKLATSKNGINWIRKGENVINLTNNERDISRSTIWFFNGKYHLWFAYNTTDAPYRVGYASSTDLVNWTRDFDNTGIKKSTSGFDNEMICYPSIIKFENKLFMFYNGNKFGIDGVGLATANI